MQSTFLPFRWQYSSWKWKFNAPVSIINQLEVFKGEKYVQNYLKLIKQGPLLFVLSAKDVYTNPELSVLLLRIIVLKLFMTGILILSFDGADIFVEP